MTTLVLYCTNSCQAELIEALLNIETMYKSATPMKLIKDSKAGYQKNFQCNMYHEKNIKLYYFFPKFSFSFNPYNFFHRINKKLIYPKKQFLYEKVIGNFYCMLP